MVILLLLLLLLLCVSVSVIDFPLLRARVIINEEKRTSIWTRYVPPRRGSCRTRRPGRRRPARGRTARARRSRSAGRPAPTRSRWPWNRGRRSAAEGRRASGREPRSAPIARTLYAEPRQHRYSKRVPRTALIAQHSELKSVHPGFPAAFIF